MIPFWVILARGLPGNHHKEVPAPHLRKERGRGFRRKEKEEINPGNVAEPSGPEQNPARKTVW